MCDHQINLIFPSNKVSLSNVALAHQEGSSGESLKPLKDVDAADEVEIVEMREMEDHSRVCNEFVIAPSELQTLLLAC